ncbi:hypothetical protein HOY80DRAFT_1005519 [Tuber brumale]|nr:hypothetical protein HOY80DRAFT_1005519 [Tuber brumale]
MTFKQLSVCLQVKREIARQILKRIEECSPPDHNIKDMLATVKLEDKIHEEPAVQKHFPAGSAKSQRIRTLALQDITYHLMAFPEIRLQQLIESFVFSDEMIFDIGAPRRLLNITRYKGEDPYALATPEKKKSGLTIMVSASITLGFKGPFWVWVKKSMEERNVNNELLQKENEAKAHVNTNTYKVSIRTSFNITPTVVSIIPTPCCAISNGSLLMRYEVIILVEAWISFYIARKFFMISFIPLLKLFKLKQADTVGLLKIMWAITQWQQGWIRRRLQLWAYIGFQNGWQTLQT